MSTRGQQRTRHRYRSVLLGGAVLGRGQGGGVAAGGGALPVLTGSTWATDGNGRGYNTPTLGSELLTDGDMENWSSATDLTSWAESTGGSSTINRESSDVYSGTYAVRFDIDASNSIAYIRQFITTPAGSWLRLLFYGKTDVAASINWDDAGSQTAGDIIVPLSTTWTQYAVTNRATPTNPGIYLNRGGPASQSVFLDQISCVALDTNTTYAYTTGSNANQTPVAKLYNIATGTQAGVIGWLDSSSNPQNFIIAIRNGSGNINLTKCVGGTYTNLISVSSTFVSDAAIEVRRPTGNTFQLWYNGSQVGTDQTISDAGIISNTIYGAFSTYSGNTFSQFTLDGQRYAFPS